MKTKDKKIAKEETKQEGKFLSLSHLMQIEVGDRDMRNAQLQMAVEEQSLKALNLSFLLLQHDIKKQQEVLANRARDYENTKNRQITVRNEIFAQYGITDQKVMAYNPLTGQLL